MARGKTTVKPVPDKTGVRTRRMPRYKGGKELSAYQKNNAFLAPKAAILAKCCECMGAYADGAYDCQIKDCPLYPYMPYGKEERPLPMDKPKRTLTEEHKEKMRQGRIVKRNDT